MENFRDISFFYKHHFQINKYYSPVALWVVCGTVLISLNAGVCMLLLKRHCGLSLCQYTPKPPPPFALCFHSLCLSLPPTGLSNQRSTSTEADVWLDAINKTIIGDGLPSRPTQLVRPSVMNHLDRGRPSRRQTLNISPVGFLKSIPVHVSAFFPALCYRSLGFWVSQQQYLPEQGIWKVLRFKVSSGLMTMESQAERTAKTPSKIEENWA